MVKDAVAKLRKEYARNSLSELEVAPDPVSQFTAWFEQAINAQVVEPNAMALATVSSGGAPSVRIVLMKDFSQAGVTFFTNIESQKGSEILANPAVALVFYWGELERQVRISGLASALPRNQVEQYWKGRPRGSQIGSYISQQSRKAQSRQDLELAAVQCESQFLDRDIPCPSTWGGFLVKPQSFEFWQGRENRLHDRIVYHSSQGLEKSWQTARLWP